MADARGGQQLEHRVQHPQARAKDRHHHDIARHPASLGLFERRVDDSPFGGEIAQCFGHEQDTDSVGDLPEHLGLGVDIAKLAERVVNEGVAHDVDGHGDGLYTNRPDRSPRAQSEPRASGRTAVKAGSTLCDAGSVARTSPASG